MYHLHTLKQCLISIHRFAFRDKAIFRLLKLLKLYFIEDVAEWSRELDIGLSDWFCSASMV
jgi:hypothetical protein